MSLKFYVDLVSQPCRSIYILLKKNNIPFENVGVRLAKGEHLSEDFEKIWRFKKVPVIDDNGFKLGESVAILRYLARTRNVGDWYPTDTNLQASIDEYLEWQHNNTRLLCSQFFQQKYLFPMILGKETSAAKLAMSEKSMSDCLDQIESLWLHRGPFITGDKITAADLWAATEIEQPRIAGYEPREGRPKLKAWIERVREATNPYYDEAHQILNLMVEKSQQKAQSK